MMVSREVIFFNPMRFSTVFIGALHLNSVRLTSGKRIPCSFLPPRSLRIRPPSMSSADEVLSNMMSMLMGLSPSGGRRNREGFLSQHAKTLETTAQIYQSGFTVSRTTGARSERRVARPYADLKIVGEREMELGRVHNGRALVCRMISNAGVITGLSAVCEDPAGDAFRIGLYNFTTARARRELDRLLPKGSLLLIMEPFYKVAADMQPIVRCDNAENVVILQPFDKILDGTPWYQPPQDHAIPANATAWKDQGNTHFKQGQYREAIDSYTRGLALEPDNTILLSNRCQARLLLGQPVEALADADAALCLDGTSIKGHQRRGRALFDLRRYREAGRSFATAARFAGENELGKESKSWLRSSTTAARESEEGAFDWASIAAKLCKDPHASIDCAPFLNSNVHIVEVGGKGLGVLAKIALEPGTLVIAEKAVALVWKGARHGIHLDFGENAMTSADDIELGDSLWSMLQQNDYLRTKVMSLSRGRSEKKTSLKNTPSLEAVRQIITANKFGTCPPNQTTIMQNTEDKSPFGSGEGSGLWEYSSRLNHSCLPNCCWGTLGDMMVIRTTRRVEAGEECCVSYLSSDEELEERTAKLQHRGFTCDCELCVLQRNQPPSVRSSMNNEVEEWREKARSKSKACKKGLPALCKKLDAIQPGLNLKSILAHTMTGYYFMLSGDDRLSLQYYSECCKRMKADPRLLTDPYTAVDTMIQCAVRCYGMRDFAGAKMWCKEARSTFALVFGSDPSLFEYGHRARLEHVQGLFNLMTRD